MRRIERKDVRGRTVIFVTTSREYLITMNWRIEEREVALLNARSGPCLPAPKRPLRRNHLERGHEQLVALEGEAHRGVYAYCL